MVLQLESRVKDCCDGIDCSVALGVVRLDLSWLSSAACISKTWECSSRLESESKLNSVELLDSLEVMAGASQKSDWVLGLDVNAIADCWSKMGNRGYMRAIQSIMVIL